MTHDTYTRTCTMHHAHAHRTVKVARAAFGAGVFFNERPKGGVRLRVARGAAGGGAAGRDVKVRQRSACQHYCVGQTTHGMWYVACGMWHVYLARAACP